MSNNDPIKMDNERAVLLKYEPGQEKVDYHYQMGDEASKSESEPMTKRSRLFVTLCILLTEMCERMTFYSLVANIVLYGKSKLGYEEVEITTINQIFGGFVYIIPIFGGFISDSYTGRFKTILASGLIYLVGLVLIPLSAIEFETFGWSDIGHDGKRALFLSGLVFVALGTGGIKANVGPFGAEQMVSLGKEAVQTFFNWFYWGINVGAFIAYAGVSYIQQEVSFAWGFFVPLLSTILALFVFVTAREYYIRTEPQGSVLVEVFAVFREGCCKKPPPVNPKMEEGSEQKLLARTKKSFGGSHPDHFVDGVTSVLKVIPFCLLTIVYWIIAAQLANTFFVQGSRLDVRLGDSGNVPVAALNIFNSLSIILLVPVVDRVLYPLLDRFGMSISYLKRIGIGMVFAASSMFVAGIVEIQRKETPYHTQILSDTSYNASSLSIFVQIPQFALVGISEIFTSITILEFAYNQAPVSMQGVLTGLFLAASGVGQWLSSAILLIVEDATKEDPWWGNEINDTHMEYLMFFLGGLLMANVVIFSVVAHYYSYQDPSTFEEDKQNNDIVLIEQTDVNFIKKGNENALPQGQDNPAYGTMS